MVQDAALVRQKPVGAFSQFFHRPDERAGVKTETLRRRQELSSEEAAHCTAALATYKTLREKPLEAMDLTSKSFAAIVRVVRNSRKDLASLRPNEQLELREFSLLVSTMMKDLGDLCHSKEYDIRTQALGLVMKYKETIRQLEGLITTSRHEDIHLGIVKYLSDEISRLKMESRAKQNELERIGDLERPDYDRRLILRVGVLSRFETARRQSVLFFADSMDPDSLDYIARNCSASLEDFEKTRGLANKMLAELQKQLKTAGISESELLKRFVRVAPSPPLEVGGAKVIRLRPRQEPDPGDDSGAAVALPKPDENEGEGKEFKKAA